MKQTHEIDGWFNYEDTYNILVQSCAENGIFVECGAWLGQSSSYLADIISLNRPDITLYVADSWLGSSAEIDTAHKLATETDIYRIFLNNMGDRKFIPIRKLSVDAAQDFDDNSIDIVFIDMSHEYKDVKEDLNVWFPKVKSDGLIAGHDWSWQGVSKAVLEKFNNHNNLHYNLPGDCWTYDKEGDIK